MPAKEASHAAGAGRSARRRRLRPRDVGLAVAAAAARHPRVVLAAVAALTLVFAAALPRLEVETDGAALHPRGDPTIERTARDRVTFGDGEELILLLGSRPGGPPVASAAGLRRLADTHRAVAALPVVDVGGVRSAASVVDVSTSGLAALGRFLDEVPDERDELASLLARLREAPSTSGLFLSADGAAAALFVPLAPGSERRRAVARLERWAEAWSDDDFALRLAGPAVAETVLGERVLADLARLVPIMVLVVAILLLVCLRTPGGLVLAMGKTLVVLVWTGGVMAMAGAPITLVTTILPVLLLALCVTDEVHVVARLEAHLAAAGGEPDGGEGGETEPAILATLGELTRPIVTTSVSTAIGFLSFLGASIGPMRSFGALAAVGILLAMVATFTLTPALAVTLPRWWWVPRGGGRRARRASHRALTAAAGRRRRAVGLAAGLLLLAAGAPGLLRLRVQDSWIDNFDPASPLVRAERELNARFWGTYRFDVVLTGGPGLFHRPDGAALVAAAARAVAGAPEVGGVVTPLEPLDRVAELLGLPVGAAALPADALRAVVEVAAAYPGQLGLERMVTADGHAARLTALVDSADYRRARALAERLERELAPLAAAAGVAVHASGDLPVATATVAALVGDQLRSIGWTLAGVAVLLFAAGRRIWMTLVQLVPPAAAAWLILAAMGWAGKPLGVATSLFAALTIGIGVDLALHVTSAYEDRRARGLAAADAVGAAFAATAAGRRWSTLVLSGGFLVLTASSFAPNRDLGLLLAAAMPAAYLTTGLFVPRMLAR